jgi:hypothetical protein
MPDPVAVITITGTSEISYASLPATRTLSGATSTWGSGTGVTPTYQWYILDKPVGSAAVFTNDTVASPNFGPIDLPGTYRVFLVVENDQGDSSFASPVPQQSATSPYAFSLPPASAFFEIRALTRYAGLKKVAYGERDWLEDGLWPIVDKVDEHEMKISQVYASEGVIKANSILEYTAGNGVTVDGVLLKDGDLKVATSSDAVYTNVIIAGSVGGGSSSLAVYATPLQVLGSQSIGGTLAVSTVNEFTVNSGVTIDGVLVKDGDVKVATSADKVFTNIIEAGSVAGGSSDINVLSGTTGFTGNVYVGNNLRSSTVGPYSDNASAIIRGRGTHTSDVDVDIIQADSNNSGVTVIGKGTHSYDLQADVIYTNSLYSAGSLSITAAAGSLSLVSPSSIAIDYLQTNIGNSSSNNSVPLTLASAYPNQATTGTTAQTLWSTNLPANTFAVDGQSITGELIFSTASATTGHNKIPTVKFNGTTVVTVSSTVSGGWIKVMFTIMRTAMNAQIGFGTTFDSGSNHGSSGLVSLTATESGVIPLLVQGETPSGAGDMTLKTVIISYNRSEGAM